LDDPPQDGNGAERAEADALAAKAREAAARIPETAKPEEPAKAKEPEKAKEPTKAESKPTPKVDPKPEPAKAATVVKGVLPSDPVF
jgi:hypothetical protein